MMFSSNCNYYRDIALQEEVDGKVVVVAHLKFTYTPLLINRLNCLPIQVSIIVKDSILSVYVMDESGGTVELSLLRDFVPSFHTHLEFSLPLD